MLRAELGFYVSCLNLSDRLAAKGLPDIVPRAGRHGMGVLVSTRPPRRLPGAPVAGRGRRQRFDADGKSLTIITGANSGGKTTFLRSVGLAQLMMQCGMFVAAESYRASVCAGSSRTSAGEEDATMVSGRLDEELRRMSVIADQIRSALPRCSSTNRSPQPTSVKDLRSGVRSSARCSRPISRCSSSPISSISPTDSTVTPRLHFPPS